MNSRFNGILGKIKEITERLNNKQKELKEREKKLLRIKDDIVLVLEILRKSKSGSQPLSNREEIILKPKKQSEIIKSLEKIIEIKHQHNVYSLIELNDSRIATGDWNGIISIFSIDYEKKKYTSNIKHQGHSDSICSLCQLSGNRLVSAGNDDLIKVWKIDKNSLSILQTLEGHSFSVNQVIPLSNDVIASGSFDKTIKIWSVTNKKELRTLEENFEVYCLLKSKTKEMLFSSGLGKQVTFWNLKTYKKEHTVNCCIANSYNGLIELSNNYIAVTGGDSSSIDIINTDTYEVFKNIKLEKDN